MAKQLEIGKSNFGGLVRGGFLEHTPALRVAVVFAGKAVHYAVE